MVKKSSYSYIDEFQFLKMISKINEQRLNTIAETCYRHIAVSDSRETALISIAETAVSSLGTYFGPEILDYPDEISANFIQLLDHIVYEMDREPEDSPVVRDYIIEDLFQRITIYLDVFHDRNIYKRKLPYRPLTYDDTIILRHFALNEFIAYLITEFHNDPTLRIWILKTLVSFKNTDLIPFFRRIITGSYETKIKALAAAGITHASADFDEWEEFSQKALEPSSYLHYASGFNIKKIHNNRIPENINEIIYVLCVIELRDNRDITKEEISWIMRVFEALPEAVGNERTCSFLHTSITNIILYFSADQTEFILNSHENLRALILAVDMLPRECFDRIIIRLDNLGEHFLRSVHLEIDTGKIELKRKESNIRSYLFWNTPVPV